MNRDHLLEQFDVHAQHAGYLLENRSIVDAADPAAEAQTLAIRAVAYAVACAAERIAEEIREAT